MTYLTTLLSKPKEAFKNLNYVHHYTKPSGVSAGYAIWKEDNEERFEADNRKAERALNGTLDYYTLHDFDPNLDSLELALESMGATWALVSTFYEDETHLIHYSWDWSVT